MTGPITVIPSNTPMPDLLRPDGLIQLLPDAFYAASIKVLGLDSLRYWCHLNGRYGVPTMELIDWLRQEISSRSVIEIGSGSGDLCFHLGIPGTDSYIQDSPAIREQMAAFKQPPVPYGGHVKKLSAANAIAEYQPQVVLASWVTQWGRSATDPPGGSSPYGVHENEIVEAGIKYILIGNITVHGGKEIMKVKHEEFDLPFLRSRSAMPVADRVWIWNR